MSNNDITSRWRLNDYPTALFLACSILRSAKYNMVGTEIAENFLLRKGAIDFSPSCSSSHKGFSFIDVLQP
jgi:hypothetical protein